MNSFGRIYRTSIFGESHGLLLGAIIDGCPAGIPLSAADFITDLQRRKSGAPGTTPRKETDEPEIVSGVFNGKTAGAPITIVYKNEQTISADYELIRQTPRPGHADFVLQTKYNGFNDYRGGGHSSGRLTLGLVSTGVIAKKILRGIDISAKLCEAGGEPDIDAAINKAIERQDSIGGVVECRVKGLSIGLGDPFFDSVESLISHAVFSIPAIKGIEFGSGFKAAGMWGSEHNDAIVDELGTTRNNNSGGINGGITNGNELVFSVAVKPTSSTPAEQRTWNQGIKSVEAFQVKGRHDLCIALRVPVVVEAVTAMVLADLKLIQKAFTGS